MAEITTKSCPFDVIVITSPDAEAAHAVRGLIKSSCGDFPSCQQPQTEDSVLQSSDGTLFISSCDPYGARMGSGGGTIAALAEADEAYARWHKKGQLNFLGNDEKKHPQDDSGGNNSTVCSTTQSPTVLICHAGGESSRCPTQIALGKAWTSLPVIKSRPSSTLSTNNESESTIETTVSNPTSLLITTLSDLFADIPKGSAIVAASDVLLSFQGPSPCPIKKKINFKNLSKDDDGFRNVFGLAVPAPLDTAANHGVFVLESSPSKSNDDDWGIQPTCNVLQKPTVEEMKGIEDPSCVFQHSTTANASQKNESMAWIDTGVVTFLPYAAETLRELSQSTLKCCTQRGLEELYAETYHGVDEGRGREKRRKINPKDSSTDQPSLPSLEEFALKSSLKIDLYSDIMQALHTTSPTTLPNDDNDNTPCQVYLKKRGVGEDHSEKDVWKSMYDALSQLKLFTCAIPTGSFIHLGTTWELMDFLTMGVSDSYEAHRTVYEDQIDDDIIYYTAKPKRNTPEQESYRQRMRSFGKSIGLTRRSCAFASGFSTGKSKTSIVLNSVLVSKSSDATIGKGSVVEHSFIECNDTRIHIGERCLISGIRGNWDGRPPFRVPPGICLQMLPLDRSKYEKDCFACVCLGVDDRIKDTPKTLFGIDLEYVLKMSALSESNLWDQSITPSKRMLWNAKLNPILRNIAGNDEDSAQFDFSFLEWICTLSMYYKQGQGSVAIEGLLKSTGLKQWKESTRLSLSEIRQSIDASAETIHRNSIPSKSFADRRMSKISEVLMKGKHEPCNFDYVLDFVTSSFSVHGFSVSTSVINSALEALDSVAYHAVAKGHFGISGRAFMTMSLLLSDIAESMQKSSNDSFVVDENSDDLDADELHKAIERLRVRDVDVEVIASIISIRDKMFRSQSSMAYYVRPVQQFLEKAASVMTERCVSGDVDFCQSRFSSSAKSISPGITVTARAPARIDLGGGWTDTPPISYEYGGAVANLAVLIDGERPLRAECRLVKGGQGILLRTESRPSRGILLCAKSKSSNDKEGFGSSNDGDLISSSEAKINTLCDLATFNDPHSDCALLKAALIYLGLVSLDSMSQDGSQDIQPYLNKFCRSEDEDIGLEVTSCSLLPTGSGLGSSSILGGCVISAISKCVGISLPIHPEDSVDTNSNNLIHAVLMLEQLLTTGGGWQDQIGGLVGGLKLGTSNANMIPLRTKIQHIPLPQSVIQELNERLVLAFTGKPRLAKNILQNVLRRWCRRSDNIIDTVNGLAKGANHAISSLDAGDLNAIGSCMSLYWKHKKNMAGSKSGVEPEFVRELLLMLKDDGVINGGTLCGAGELK